MVKVCHPLPCTRQAKPGLPWEMRPLAATCRGSGHPITLCDLQLARRHARGHQVHRYHEQGRQDGPLLHGGARYGRRAAIASAARLLTGAAVHAFAGRLRAAVRVWASSLARSSPLLALHAGMCSLRPTGRVARSAGATLVRSDGRVEAPVFFILAHSHLGTT